MFQVGLPFYLGLNSGRSVLIKLDKTRKHFPEKFVARACFPNVRSFHTGNIVSSVSFCFQDANYACATEQGTLTKIRACEHLQNFCEHEQASTNLILRAIRAKAKFCEHFRIGWDHSTPLIYDQMEK